MTDRRTQNHSNAAIYQSTSCPALELVVLCRSFFSGSAEPIQYLNLTFPRVRPRGNSSIWVHQEINGWRIISTDLIKSIQVCSIVVAQWTGHLIRGFKISISFGNPPQDNNLEVAVCSEQTLIRVGRAQYNYSLFATKLSIKHQLALLESSKSEHVVLLGNFRW